MIRKIILISICLCSSLSADLVKRFPFSLGTHSLYTPRGEMYVGAAQAIPNNELSVAIAGRTSDDFVGLTPKKVQLNRLPSQLNPLYGAAIEHLALMDRRPVVIPRNAPTSLFLIEGRVNPIEVTQSAPLRDANAQLAPSVLAVTTSAANVPVALEAGASLAAIAAVPNPDGGFDGNGSGIALAFFRRIEDRKMNVRFSTWDVVDANTGASSFTDEGDPTDYPLTMIEPQPTLLTMPRRFFEHFSRLGVWHAGYLASFFDALTNGYHPKATISQEVSEQVKVVKEEELSTPLTIYAFSRAFETYMTQVRRDHLIENSRLLLNHPVWAQRKKAGNKAKPFGKDTPELFITSPAELLENALDLHFDRDMGRLYIATRVTAAQGADDGARALVVASITNGRVHYQAIAPESAFNNQNHIVGKKEPGSKTTIYKVRTMQTRTHLRYLIVVGGNGDSPELQKAVFALPIVDNMANSAHGTLANITALPATLYGKNPPHAFRTRVFVVPAQQPDELYTMNDSTARVGGLGTLPGPITDIQVSAEAVFVSCERDDALNPEALSEGMFYSQPVFDTFGRISGWTDWHRVANDAEPTNGFNYDALAGIFWYLPQSEGPAQNVFRNKWSKEKDPLSMFISCHLSVNNGGVQGLDDFPFTTLGFSQDPAQRLAVQIFTGYKKVLIMQTGKQVDERFAPFVDLKDVYTSSDGTLNGFKGAANLSLSGGVLDQVGPISSAAVVSNGTTGWFVVAGTGGVAVLADANGRGWNAQTGLTSGFQGISSSASWQLISSTPHVRKLLTEDGLLFALSQNKLERFELSQSGLQAKNVSSVVLSELTPEERSGAQSYSDMHIKGPLAVLATSTGLFRSGNGKDIRTSTRLDWIEVPLLESVGSLTSSGPVSRLFSISTKNAQDNLYILNAYVGLSQALIYRLVLSIDNGRVTDTSVKLFPDFIIQGINSFFTNIGDYRNYLVTDGALIALSRSSFSGKPPLVELLPPTIKSSDSAGNSRVPFVVLPSDSCTIGKIVRNSASGAWMAPGDFGVRVQN